MDLTEFFPEESKPKHKFKKSTDKIEKVEKQTDIIGVNLVDYSQIVISTIMATYKPNDELNLDTIRHVVINTIRANVLKNRKNYNHVILCVDNAQGGYWRKKVAPYYKGRRAESREKNKYDFDVILESMQIIKKELTEHMPYVIMDIAGLEADDHIAVLSKHFGNQGIPVLITSSDGDFTQLHDIPKLKQWSPILSKWVKPKYGKPKDDLRFKCLKGDKKDGIASYKAVSNHYMLDGVRSPSIRQEELKHLMSCTEEEIELTLSQEHFKRYQENKLLLDFDLIPLNLQKDILSYYEDYKVAPRSVIYQYFVSKGLTKLITSINEF